MWHVTALGYETGSEYTYEVDLPVGTNRHVVFADANQQHSRLKIKGLVPENLQAGRFRAEYIEGSVMEYCLNCTQTYKDTPKNRPQHMARCTRCGSDGHAACQH
jgi:hypothetical protein